MRFGAVPRAGGETPGGRDDGVVLATGWKEIPVGVGLVLKAPKMEDRKGKCIVVVRTKVVGEMWFGVG